MTRFSGKKNIFWDFDGVIIDSQEIRNKGFLEILNEYPVDQVEELMKYHLKNGGLSRYVKFNYFFEVIRGEELPKEKMKKFLYGFSEIMRRNLSHKKLLIQDSLQFIENNHQEYRMHIISGSDGKELRYLCDLLGLEDYFISIDGSPTPKVELVTQVLQKFSYLPQESVLIGDAINDFEAAEKNGVEFLGYNNPELVSLGAGYLKSFS